MLTFPKKARYNPNATGLQGRFFHVDVREVRDRGKRVKRDADRESDFQIGKPIRDVLVKAKHGDFDRDGSDEYRFAVLRVRFHFQGGYIRPGSHYEQNAKIFPGTERVKKQRGSQKRDIFGFWIFKALDEQPGDRQEAK